MMSNVIKRTTSAYSAARGLDIVPRLIAFVLCFYIAITPAVVYASAAPNLIFNNVSNLVKTGAGIVADYAFKRGNASNDPNYNAANDNYYKKNHAVSNNQMGKVWRNRWAGLSNGIGGGLLATAVIAGLLSAADWILDPANNTIRKRVINPNFVFCPVTTYNSDCSSSPSAPFDILKNGFYKINYTYNYTSHDMPPDSVVNNFSVNNFYSYTINYDAVYTANGSSSVTHKTIDAYIYVLPSSESLVNATDADIAAAVAQADVDTLQQLATSPDYILEQHAPTIAAAAAAEPETTTTPEPDKSNLGTKVETTTTTNPDGSKTTTTTTTPLNPNGTPALNPDGTPQTPHVQTTTTKPDGSTTTTTNGAKPADTKPPIFCDWAKTLCDWIGWTKQNPDAVAAATTAVVVAETAESDILPNFDISQQRVVFASSCPAGIPIHFSMMGSSVDTTFSYQPLCDFMAALKPFVIASAYITGAYIISGVGRAGGNNG